MKSEHKKLKAICDVIGFELEIEKSVVGSDMINYPIDVDIEVDVREIIFTQDFMDRVWVYLCENLDDNEKSIEALSKCEVIIYHLNNPVDYLYNTLKLWKQ